MTTPIAPNAATLRRLYVVEDRPMADLAARYHVGSKTVREWLAAAGIPIRTHTDAGRRRTLVPPPASELSRLCTEEHQTVADLARRFRVSYDTAVRWLTDAGVTAPKGTTKNRPRGAPQPVAPPERDTLLDLYVTQDLSLARTAARLGATIHLVRTWLGEAGIPLRPAVGRPGVPHAVPRRKPPPPADELRALRERDRLSRDDLARRYGVHPQTISTWLAEAGLPGRLPPRPALIPDTEMIRLYQQDGLTAVEIARRAGVPDSRVLRVLHAAEVPIDPTRQAAAVRNAMALRPKAPALPPADGDWAEARYRDDHWSCNRIADALGCPITRVRSELRARHVPILQPVRAERGNRQQAPVEDLQRLYVESERPAVEVGAILGVPTRVVYRTGHANGLPIRQGGHPIVSATIRLINGLYHDELVTAVLDKYDVPRRPPIGDIAERFPVPVPLTAGLLTDLYVEAGCSTPQIELLTGQPHTVVQHWLHAWGIPVREQGFSPALYRLRATAREQFLAEIVTRYRETGSTVTIAKEYGCATDTVRRWLAAAGVRVPGRGHWPRHPHTPAAAAS